MLLLTDKSTPVCSVCGHPIDEEGMCWNDMCSDSPWYSNSIDYSDFSCDDTDPSFWVSDETFEELEQRQDICNEPFSLHYNTQCTKCGCCVNGNFAEYEKRQRFDYGCVESDCHVDYPEDPIYCDRHNGFESYCQICGYGICKGTECLNIFCPSSKNYGQPEHICPIA